MERLSFKNYFSKKLNEVSIEEGVIDNYKKRKQEKKQLADEEASKSERYANAQWSELTKEYINFIKQNAQSADQRLRREVFQREYPVSVLKAIIYKIDSTLAAPKDNKNDRLTDMLADAIIKKFATDASTKNFKASYM